MFQNFVDEHITRFGLAVTPTMPSQVGRSVRTLNATVPGRNGVSGIISAATVASRWHGWCAVVADNRGLRSDCMLTYSYAVEGHLSASPGVANIMPVLFDRQAATALGSGMNVWIANSTDFQWGHAECEEAESINLQIRCRGKGRSLVTPYITSATGGVTSREFGVGVRS